MLARTVTANDIHSQSGQAAEEISAADPHRPKEKVVLANGGFSQPSEAGFGLSTHPTSLRRTYLQEVKENLFKD